MSELLGDAFKLFYDTAASFSTPTWVEQTSVGDIGYDTAPEMVEIPKRNGFKCYLKGRNDLSFKFTMNYDPSSTFHKAVIGAINAGTAIHMAMAPGAIAGGGYWHMWCLPSGPVDGKLDAAASVEVECKVHATGGNDPAFVTWS